MPLRDAWRTGRWSVCHERRTAASPIASGLELLRRVARFHGVFAPGAKLRPFLVPPAEEARAQEDFRLRRVRLSEVWIKKFPLTPMESCGATAVEVAEALNGVKVLNEATQPTVDEAAEADGAEDAAKESNDPDDGWRQHCKDTYVACKDQKGWVGDCYACFRYCEGQRQWPFHLCTRKGKLR